jgi:hypothetical protein
MHLNNVVAHSIEYDLAYSVHIQFSHNIASMGLDRLHTQVEECSNIL